MNTCETCRWWARGRVYTKERYGDIPERVAWSAAQTGKYTIQDGECRIVAPYRCGGYFPTTFEFQGCGEHQPADKEPTP